MSLAGVNCSRVSAPAPLSFLTASVSFVLFLITVPGNFLVCLVVYRDPQHNLRTPFNLFVVNLAFADLVVGLLVDPTSVVIHLREGLTGGSLAGVQVIHLAYFISCTASLLSLAALTVDRYIAVMRPHFYRTRLNSTRAGNASAVIWVLSTTLPCVLYFHVGYMKYAFVFANSAVILTLVILLVSYVQIYRRVHQQFTTSDQLYGGQSEVNRRRRNARTEARVTKAFLLVLVTFLMCYLPSCVMIYLMNLCLRCSCHTIHWLRDMQFLLVSLNSGLNPFLYSWRLPNFRTAVMSILRIRPKNGRNRSGPFMVVSGSSKGNNEGLENLCAVTALSGLNTITAPMKVAISCQKSNICQMQLTTSNKLTFQKFREEELTAREFDARKSDGTKTDERQSAVCEEKIQRNEHHVQNTGKPATSRGSCGNSNRHVEELETRYPANQPRCKFKQRRTSSAHAVTSPARLHARMLRSTSLV